MKFVIVLASLLAVAFAAEDQSGEEWRVGHWRGHGWGPHHGGGWSRQSSWTPHGGQALEVHHGRWARSVEDQQVDENRRSHWGGRSHWGSHGLRGSWGGHHGLRHGRSVEDQTAEEHWNGRHWGNHWTARNNWNGNWNNWNGHWNNWSRWGGWH